jgi:hypothetical protein
MAAISAFYRSGPTAHSSCCGQFRTRRDKQCNELVRKKVDGRFIRIIEHAYCSRSGHARFQVRSANVERYREGITMSEERITRREAIKKAAYATPVILTMLVAPSFASAGSGKVNDKKDDKEKRDKRKKFKWKD